MGRRSQGRRIAASRSVVFARGRQQESRKRRLYARRCCVRMRGWPVPRYVRLAIAGLLVAAAAGVCLAQPDSSDTAAVLVSAEGQISVLRDSIPWALETGDRVKPKQIIVSGPDGHAIFRVSDGSTFEVFPNSRVTFRETPGNLQDLLEVLIGKIKVHIQKWGGQPNPNKVRTPSAIISVRGTTFEVTVEDGDSTVVFVEEGEVDIQHAAFPAKQPVRLNAGETLRVYKNVPLSQAGIDRMGIARKVATAVMEAIYTASTQDPRGRTPGTVPGPGGGGTPLPTDRTGKTPPPSTTPPPPSDSGPGAPPPPPPPPPK